MPKRLGNAVRPVVPVETNNLSELVKGMVCHVTITRPGAVVPGIVNEIPRIAV
jgi:hypothetical protein